MIRPSSFSGEARKQKSDPTSCPENELRTLLNGVSSANLVRRYQLELIAGHAYAIAARLARDPANAVLIPLVEEMQRLRKLERRKKPSSRTEPEVPPEPAKSP